MNLRSGLTAAIAAALTGGVFAGCTTLADARAEYARVCAEHKTQIAEAGKREIDRIYDEYPRGFERDVLLGLAQDRTMRRLDAACPPVGGTTCTSVRIGGVLHTMCD